MCNALVADILEDFLYPNKLPAGVAADTGNGDIESIAIFHPRYYESAKTIGLERVIMKCNEILMPYKLRVSHATLNHGIIIVTIAANRV